MKHRGFETPSCMAGRPVDHRGFPVPWFVTLKDPDGNWDFSTVDPHRFYEAVKKNVCWVSGTPLGRWKSFVIGPMCLVNRVSGDPPVRFEVAEWSVKICPFLSRPLAKRVERDDDNLQRGIMLKRNPGVSLIYTTDDTRFTSDKIFQLGEPRSVSFWSEGRPATPAEVWKAYDTGIGSLKDMATADGPEAEAELDRYIRRAMTHMPERPAEAA